PTTLALSISSLAPWKQTTTWDFTSSIDPLGRPSSCWQLIVGTLYCICGLSAGTSGPLSFANAAYARPPVGLVDRFSGAVSLLAAAQTVAPTFFSAAARSSSTDWLTGASVSVVAPGVGVGAGALGV